MIWRPCSRTMLNYNLALRRRRAFHSRNLRGQLDRAQPCWLQPGLFANTLFQLRDVFVDTTTPGQTTRTHDYRCMEAIWRCSFVEIHHIHRRNRLRTSLTFFAPTYTVHVNFKAIQAGWLQSSRIDRCIVSSSQSLQIWTFSRINSDFRRIERCLYTV